MNLACFVNVPSQDFQDHFKITRLTKLSLKLFDPLEFVKHIDSKNKTSQALASEGCYSSLVQILDSLKGAVSRHKFLFAKTPTS